MQEQMSICVSEDEVKTDEYQTSHMISGFDFVMNFAVIMGKWATTMFLKLFWFLMLSLKYKNLKIYFCKLFVLLFPYLNGDINLSSRTV